MTKNGATFESSFKIKHISEEKVGIVASRDLNPGESLFTIPFELLMTPEKCSKTPLGLKLRQLEGTFENQNDYFTLFILNEKQNKLSPYKAYIDTLPT